MPHPGRRLDSISFFSPPACLLGSYLYSQEHLIFPTKMRAPGLCGKYLGVSSISPNMSLSRRDAEYKCINDELILVFERRGYVPRSLEYLMRTHFLLILHPATTHPNCSLIFHKQHQKIIYKPHSASPLSYILIVKL